LNHLFIIEVVCFLVDSISSCVLTANFEQCEVLELFSCGGSYEVVISALGIQAWSKDEYDDEEELLIFICNDVVDRFYGLKEMSNDRDILFNQICDVANTIVTDLRLAVKKELALVERDVISLEPANT
jgi:hypothetical protein